MRQTISKNEFRDGFKSMGRSDSFSYQGLGALFEFLEELEEETGLEIEYDVIALCGEWREYESATEACWNYGCDMANIDEDEAEGLGIHELSQELERLNLEILKESTTVLEFHSEEVNSEGKKTESSGIVIEQF